MSAIRKVFAGIPRAVCVLTGAVLAVLVLLVMFGESALSFAYQNQAPVSGLVAGCVGIAAAGLLLLAGGRFKNRTPYPVWLLCIVFGLVLAGQFVIARSCWFHLGWDPGAVHTAAEEMARGLPLSMPEYFELCPNNAPLTVLLAAPLWLAIRVGLSVPYAVLPYLDAVLLNLSAFAAVLCVRKLTKNTLAHAFSLVVAIGWIALSPYLLYPYTDTFSILFPVLALFVYLHVKRPAVKWFLVSLCCFLGASIKPTVLIVLLALIGLGVCGFGAGKIERGWWKRAVAVAAALVLGAVPGRAFQKMATAYVTGSAVPEGQLSVTHYLMLGMNGETYGGHSPEDVAFSQSFETLDQRQSANLRRAWERLSGRSVMENVRFFAVKAYKAYADGSFASHGSFLEVDVPQRGDAISRFLRSLYHKNGQLMPYCQTLVQCLWLGVLTLCAAAAVRRRRHPAVALLCLTLLGLTAYLLLFEVWPRYLFLYAPFFVILASMAFDKPSAPVL